MPRLAKLWLAGNTLFLEDDADIQVHRDLVVPASLAELIVEFDAPFADDLLDGVLSRPEAMTCLTALDVGTVYQVPESVGRLPALRELCVNVDNVIAQAHPELVEVDDSGVAPAPLAALVAMTTLRELTLTTEYNQPVAALPYLPGLTRLEVSDKAWSASNVAANAPNLQHLRISFSDFVDDLAPLAALTTLTSIVFDAVVDHNVPTHDDAGRPACLPRNLHLVRSLRHLCVHGCCLSGTAVVRRALGACAATTVCDATEFYPELPRRRSPVRSVPCPVAPTRYHRDYE